MTIPEAINLAIEHQNAGRLAEAEVVYRQVLNVQPDHPEALHWLGTIAMQCGALEPARQLIERAVEVSPNYAEAQCSLGDLLATLGKPQEAAAAYRRALELRSNFVEAVNNLGTVLTDLGQTQEAIAAYRKAQSLQPDSPQPWCNLSRAMLDLGQTEEALAAAREALARDDGFADAHNNVGAAMLRKGEVDAALSSFRLAVQLRPEFPLARSNLGMVLLLKGDFANGWREYEWRLRLSNSFKFWAHLSGPQWNGEDLSGKTIFLHAEQGYGDVIQFARYIPLVAERGAKVILGCDATLSTLIGRVKGVAQSIVYDEPLPSCDFHCPLPSLPTVFNTAIETIPADIPYLNVEPQKVGKWQARLRGETKLKVGLAWAGRPEHTNNRNRSISLATLAPLAEIQDIHWFSLQKGEAATQASRPPIGMELTDWTNELQDFDDTASLIANLDLVISVDTSVVHLAGAIDKPVWVLLPAVPDWRWLLGRSDSPWYPTVRLFRQVEHGDWTDVLQELKQALLAAIESHESSRR